MTEFSSNQTTGIYSDTTIYLIDWIHPRNKMIIPGLDIKSLGEVSGYWIAENKFLPHCVKFSAKLKIKIQIRHSLHLPEATSHAWECLVWDVPVANPDQSSNPRGRKLNTAWVSLFTYLLIIRRVLSETTTGVRMIVWLSVYFVVHYPWIWILQIEH